MNALCVQRAKLQFLLNFNDPQLASKKRILPLEIPLIFQQHSHLMVNPLTGTVGFVKK